MVQSLAQTMAQINEDLQNFVRETLGRHTIKTNESATQRSVYQVNHNSNNSTSRVRSNLLSFGQAKRRLITKAMQSINNYSKKRSRQCNEESLSNNIHYQTNFNEFLNTIATCMIETYQLEEEFPIVILRIILTGAITPKSIYQFDSNFKILTLKRQKYYQ